MPYLREIEFTSTLPWFTFASFQRSKHVHNPKLFRILSMDGAVGQLGAWWWSFERWWRCWKFQVGTRSYWWDANLGIRSTPLATTSDSRMPKIFAFYSSASIRRCISVATKYCHLRYHCGTKKKQSRIVFFFILKTLVGDLEWELGKADGLMMNSTEFESFLRTSSNQNAPLLVIWLFGGLASHIGGSTNVSPGSFLRHSPAIRLITRFIRGNPGPPASQWDCFS